jgi:hypothetical protein
MEALTAVKESVKNMMPEFNAEAIRTKDDEDELALLLANPEPSELDKGRITELNAKQPYVPPPLPPSSDVPVPGGRRRRRRSQKQYGGSKRRSRSGSRRRRYRKSRKGGRK